MPAVTALVASVFVDEIAGEVEHNITRPSGPARAATGARADRRREDGLARGVFTWSRFRSFSSP